MDKDLLKYNDIVNEAFAYFKLPLKNKTRGLALHDVKFDESSKSFSYQCINTDQEFISILGIQNVPHENISYSDLFPETKEVKFNWSAVLGHVAHFQSNTIFYCFSQSSLKWFRFIAISPEKDTVLLVAEDITGEKEQEIAKNIARFNNIADES